MTLDEWMRAHGHSDGSMAPLLGCSRVHVGRLRRLEKVPRPPLMARIVEATAGKVSANDFYAVADGASS